MRACSACTSASHEALHLPFICRQVDAGARRLLQFA